MNWSRDRADVGRLFNMAMSGTRDESPYVNHQLVQQDVEALYRAGPGKIGTVSARQLVI